LPDWRADSCDPLHNPDIPHITLAEFAQAGGNQEFYLVHKIAMDISFRIEYGIFIPHTPLIASQTPTDPEAERNWCRSLRPPALLITEGNHRYEYTTETA
jgi:hypothetical protein